MDIFTVPVADKILQVIFGDGGYDVILIGKSGGKIKQETVFYQARVIRFAFGIFPRPFVRFIQKNKPFTVIFAQTIIQQRFLLRIRDIIGAIKIHAPSIAKSQAAVILAKITQRDEIDLQAAGFIKILNG